MKPPLKPTKPSIEPWDSEPFFWKAFPFVFGAAFGLVAIIILANLFVVTKVALSLANADFSHGLEPVVNQLWCGKSDCQ